MARKIDIRKFRHDIATLKKRGLISGVDARSVVPNRRLNSALDKYDAVLSGKASAVKLDKKGLAEYKAMGKPFEIAKPVGLPQRVIIPHDANERVTVTHGKVRVANPAGVTREIHPVKFQNLEKYLTELAKQKPKLKKGEQFAFRFFDNKSLRTFPTLNSLVNYLSHYESVFDSIEENKYESQQEIYQNLEIVKVQQPEAWKERNPRRESRYRDDSKYRRRRKKLKSQPAKLAEYREQVAERQRDYRKRLKGADLEAYKAAARKRAKKSKKAAKTAKRTKSKGKKK